MKAELLSSTYEVRLIIKCSALSREHEHQAGKEREKRIENCYKETDS